MNHLYFTPTYIFYIKKLQKLKKLTETSSFYIIYIFLTLDFIFSYFSGPQGSLTVCLFTFENGVPLMR